MKTAITLRRLAVAALTATTIAVGPVDHVVDAGQPGPEVPERIDVEDGNKVFLVGHAVGVQIYRCNAGTSFSWGPVAPRADLIGDNGKLIATHYAGPSWKTLDGSTVTATRVDGVTVESDAIQWLLLKATPALGTDGDRLAETTFIQRTNTTGGMAPGAATCNAETAGNIVEIPYTADYYFWKSNR